MKKPVILKTAITGVGTLALVLTLFAPWPQGNSGITVTIRMNDGVSRAAFLYEMLTDYKGPMITYLWLMLFSMPLTVLLAWLRTSRSSLIGSILCAALQAYCLIGLRFNFVGYNLPHYLLAFSPLLVAILCGLLFKLSRDQSTE